jgi:tetratricopeptide (TPR) repeat protein
VTGALVSGQDRVALFLEGSQAWCVRPQSPSPQPVSQGLLPYLFEDIASASYHPEATLASTGRLLEKACREERGLQLALISMDPSSSETTRELADDALEEFLEHSHVLEFIENRLFSKRLPESALWHGDVEFDAYPKVSLLKRSVIGKQEAIWRVREAWDALSENLFAETDDRFRFGSALVDTGAFRVLATAVAGTGEWHSKGDAQVRLLSDRHYQAYANFRNILVEWTRALPISPQVRGQLIREVHDDEDSERRRDKPSKATPYEAFQNVIRQKEAILDQLSRRKFQQVERFVDDLVQLQLSNEQPDLAAKSLCDLARGAKQLGLPAYQWWWSRRAKELNPDDPWVHTQFADALLGQRKFPEALEAYEATVRDFPEDVVARNGKAEVLKALRRLPEALEAYEATVGDFPDNVFARNGKAEMLKALGRLPDALAAYEAAIRDFPEDVVARNGKAEVLKALGRLPEALEAYEGAVRDFPQDAVARNGKAEVLKALGCLPEALEAYEATVRDFPESVVARSGKAEVLKALGRLPEALEAYEATVGDFPEDVVARSGKAEVLKALGRLPEALEAYEATVRDFPENVVARSGKAEVLKALGRLPEALEAYEATVRDFPQDAVARSGKAVLLIQLGRYEEAAALVRTDQTQTREEWIGLHIQASIKLKQERFDEADKLFSAGTQCPWAEVRSRFIGARAVLRIKTKQLKEAEALIRSERSVISKVIQIDIYRRMKRVGEAKSVLRELRGCGIAKIVEISRDLEQNMKLGRRTVSDDEFLEREIELLLAS